MRASQGSRPNCPQLKLRLSGPNGLAFDGEDNLYISDSGNSRIRKVDRQGTINTFTTNFLRLPGGLSLDGTATLYVSETDNDRIWRISPDGQMSVDAGIGTAAFSRDGGAATLARMDSPGGLAARGGNLFIADSGNRRVRKVDADVIISTGAGTGGVGMGGFGDSGPAVSRCYTTRRLWHSMDRATSISQTRPINEFEKSPRMALLIP